jgi:thiopurine S-methyltransferase
MELSYWESRWNNDKTGFHMQDGYESLRTHWPSLSLPPEPNVLVPLCGKSLDMLFLKDQGANVTGIEISEKAVKSFFIEKELEFEISHYSDFTIYTSGKIQLWQGDFMKFPESKANFHLIYDKAALVALPPKKRQPYANKLLELTQTDTKILLHHFIYPQDEMTGPPFSVSINEVNKYFSGHFSSYLLEENQIPSKQFMPFRRRGLRSAITERLILLEPR